ncbi:MAG: dihydroorotase [bacterium]
MKRKDKSVKFLIKGGKVIDPSSNINDIYDILISGEKIETIKKKITPEKEYVVIDATGMAVVPGIVDLNVHISEPTRYDRETIGSVLRAAVSGGVTAFACKSNEDVKIDNHAIVAYFIRSAMERGLSKLIPVCAMTKNLEGREMAEIGQMALMGAKACSDNTHSIMDSNLQRRILEYAHSFGLTPILYPEDKYLSSGGVINEGYISMLTGLPAIPAIAEEIMVNRDLILAEMTDIPIHIAPITTEGSVKLIKKAKDKGVKITCETCPHYFLLNDNFCKDFNPIYKVRPPLRTEKDKVVIKNAIVDGTIDVISSDHSPLIFSDKDTEFLVAEFGISGIETLFPLLYTYLVEDGSMKFLDLMKLLSYNPSRIIKHDGGTLKPNSPADIAIIDTKKEWTIQSTEFFSRGRNTPFENWSVKGKVKVLLVNGKMVYKDGVINPNIQYPNIQ